MTATLTDRLVSSVAARLSGLARDVRVQASLDGATVLTLRRGQGPAQEVRRVQGILGVPADGDFGPATEAAVRRYQAAHQIVSDRPGTVGPETQRALRAEVVLGVDLSRWQGDVDFSALWRSGVRWAVLKASQRGTAENFQINRAKAEAVGMPVGAYHFAVTSESPAWNVARFMTANDLHYQLDGPPVLDLEDRRFRDPPRLLDWTWETGERLADETGRRPWLYSRPSFWLGNLAGSKNPIRWPERFWRLPELFDLWRIGYTGTSDPGPVSPWSSWAAWQWTADAARILGIRGVKSKGLDGDWLAGDAGWLRRALGR